MINTVIENYKIISLLGKGGMGTVYKAYDLKLDRYVAIKILNSNYSDEPRFSERFKKEAKNHAQLSHPNIVTVYGFIEYEGFLGIVMEYVEGESLEKIIQKQGRLHLIDAVYVLKQLLTAIGYAHSRGFIHRDIKPSNIIFNSEGQIKIMDFGISKYMFDRELTKTGSKIGTIYYMSPEQIKNRDITHQTDIYSIGVTFFEMITGKPPFYYESEYDIMDGHLKQEVPSVCALMPGTPSCVDAMISKAMKKNAFERFATCEEFLMDCDSADKYLSDLKNVHLLNSGKRKVKDRLFSLIVFFIFLILFIILSYYVYNQVKDFYSATRVKQMKEMGFESWFAAGEEEFILKDIKGYDTGSKHSFTKILPLNNMIYAFTKSGEVLLSHNSGDSWEKKTIKEGRGINDAFFLNTNRIIGVGDSGLVFIADTKFDSIKIVNTGISGSLLAIAENRGKIFTAGGKGIILQSSDNGLTWKNIYSGTSEILYDILFLNNGVGLICGWNGTILRTKDYGSEWSVTPNFTKNYLKCIESSESGNIIAAGGKGEIFLSRDIGISWSKINSGVDIPLEDIFFKGKSGFIAGSKGVILGSEDNGETWRRLKFDRYNNITSISGFGKHLYLSGSDGLLIKF